MPQRPANLYICGDRIVWASSAFFGGETARPAPALLIGVHGPLLLQQPNGNVVSARIWLVAPQVCRTIDARGAGFVSINVDPATSWARTFRQVLAGQSVRDLSDGLTPELISLGASLIESPHGCEASRRILEAILQALFPLAFDSFEAIDPRLQKLVLALRERRPTRLFLKDWAPVAGLSPGRLSHLFREETGVTLSAYLQWLKMIHAASLFSRDWSMTEVAADIGFADSSHLCHVFREYFSVNPSWLADTQQVRVCDCPDPIAV